MRENSGDAAKYSPYRCQNNEADEEEAEVSCNVIYRVQVHVQPGVLLVVPISDEVVIMGVGLTMTMNKGD